MTETQLRNSVVDIMQQWVGCKTGDKTQRSIIKTYNSIKPLPMGYKLSYNEAWCAATISAAGYLAGLQDICYPHMNCGSLVSLYKKHGRWVEDDAYVPSPGDFVIFYWKDNGVGDCTSHASHVGIVEWCDGKKFGTIEGNMGVGVCGRRIMEVNGKYIRGFCCPDYASKATKGETEEIRYHIFEEIPEWAKYDIKGLIDSGALKGANGDLNLSDDMMRSLIISKRYADNNIEK